MRFLRIAALLGAMLGIAPAAFADGQSDYLVNCARSGCHGVPVGNPPSFSGVTGLPISLPTSLTNISNAGMTWGLPTTTLTGIVDYLDGITLAPVVGLNPTTLSFGNQQVGTTSAAKTITLSNTGNAALNLSSIVASAAFKQTNTCGASVAAGANCTISVSFAPTTAVAATGTLTITDDAAGSPQSVALTGTGTPVPAPAASVSPTSLTFGSTTIGMSSAAQAVTLSNTGNASLSITSIAASSGFSQTNSCSSAVAAGSSCMINVTFTPTAVGAASGTLKITDAATGSPQSVPLSGTGLAAPAPSVGLAPTSLVFGSQQVGTSSTAQPITLSNLGSASLSISSIKASTAFAQTNDCGSSLGAGSSCTIQVSFAPTAAGAASGTVSIADNAAGSPHAVAVSGTGTVASAPAVTLSATNLSFGNQAVGTASAPQTLTITDSGSAALTLSSLSASGDFAIAGGSCSTSSPVAAGANCTVQVTFTPTTTGPRSGLLTIADDAGSPSTVTLQGSGTSTTGTPATVLPATLTFDPQPLNTTSAGQTLTVTNTSATGSQSISGIAIGGANASDFSQSSHCHKSLAPGASCSIQVHFSPTASGARSATLSVVSSAGGSLSASLSGTGVAQSGAILSFGTGTLNFGQQMVGTTSWPKWLSLSNTGTATLHISAVTASGDFVVSRNACGATLAARSHCGVAIEFKPTATGTSTGALQVASDTTGTASSVALTGTGVTSVTQPPPEDDGVGTGTSSSTTQMQLQTSTTTLQFDATSSGATSAPLTAYVMNAGRASGTVAQVGVSGSGFALASDGCSGKTLAASAGCTVSVVYTATGYVNDTGTLSVSTSTGTMKAIALAASAPVSDASVTSATPADSGGGGAIGGWALLLLMGAAGLRRRPVASR